MIVLLDEVVSPANAEAMVGLLGDASMESGHRTAGKLARAIKQNLQGDAADDRVETVLRQAREALLAHPLFKRHAVLAKFGRLLVSRYESGMAYGKHFDDAIIAGIRTDLSFTLFLSPPDLYAGGELELFTSAGSQAIKLPPGCAVLYPTDQLHQVRPVTQGERIAVVGWAQSRVRSAEQRSILADLDTISEHLSDGDSDTLLHLRHIRNRLLRMWMDS
ncbi:MAG: Fe2+-dependent dioxygenase [Pseudomonadota bacterium]